MTLSEFVVSTITVAAESPGHDRVGVKRITSGLTVAVADGAGGAGGDAASAAEFAVSRVCDVGEAETHERGYWARVLCELDQSLAIRPAGGESALVVAAVSERHIEGAAVGDCVAWLITSTEVQGLTAGTPRKPLLGSGAALPREFGPLPLGDDALLLATDGLANYAVAERIAECVRSLIIPGSLEPLVDLVRLRSGALQDDVAAALVRRSAANGRLKHPAAGSH